MEFQYSEDLFTKVPIVGILRGYTKEKTLKIIEVYRASGLTNIEVTMNTPDVEQIIKEAIEQHAGHLNIGAGTVCTVDDIERALNAGAQFIVCPITDVNLIEHCKKQNIPIFPGAFSPTEIFQASSAGARMVKIFPASQFGPKYIKDVLAPLNSIEMMPTGGVSLENIKTYKSIGVKAFGMGSLLFDKQLIQEENWDGLKKHLKEVKSVVIS